MVVLENIDKIRVAKQFSRAAKGYDKHARIQEQIALDALAQVSESCNVALDVGCGSGRMTARLSAKCQHVIGLDLAEGMVSHAASRDADVSWLVADAEHLPIANNAVDLVFSSMALQWCPDMKPVFSEFFRVLKPGGRAVLAILSEGSMRELSASWRSLDCNQHVNQFRSPECLFDAALASGLTGEVHSHVYTDMHTNIRNLLNSIKGVGANVVNQTGNHSVLKRDTLSKLEAVYQQQHAQSDLLPLSYVVTFLTLRKPQ